MEDEYSVRGGRIIARSLGRTFFTFVNARIREGRSRCTAAILPRYRIAVCLYVRYMYVFISRNTFITICDACQMRNNFPCEREKKEENHGESHSSLRCCLRARALTRPFFHRYFPFHRLRRRIAPNFAEFPFARLFVRKFAQKRSD